MHSPSMVLQVVRLNGRVVTPLHITLVRPYTSMNGRVNLQVARVTCYVSTSRFTTPVYNRLQSKLLLCVISHVALHEVRTICLIGTTIEHTHQRLPSLYCYYWCRYDRTTGDGGSSYRCRMGRGGRGRWDTRRFKLTP